MSEVSTSVRRSLHHQLERLEQRIALAGDLKFQTPLTVDVGSESADIRWQIQADFNGDGDSDIAAGLGDVRQNLHVALSTPGQSFVTQSFELGVSTQGAAGDLDGDGDVDLVVAASRLQLLLNAGVDENGTWLGFGDPLTLPRSGNVQSILLEDVDADGSLDILTGTDADVRVLLNREGEFSDPISYLSGSAESGRGLTVGDFDQDGDTDIAVANSDGSEGQLSLLLGNGDGTFEESPNSYPVRGSGVAAGDFDDDGDLDLAVAQNYSYDDNVAVMMGHGDGTFDLAEKHRIVGTPHSVVVDDVNGDGNLDLVVGHGGFVHLENYGNGPGGVSLLLGTGTGTFQAPIRLMAADGSLSVGDINGDGAADLATTGYTDAGPAVKVLMAAPNSPSFLATHAILPAGKGPAAISIADVDGDGTGDMVVTNQRSADVTLRHGNGDATFGDPQHHRVGRRPTATFPFDFNGDAITDLAVVNESDISLLIGQGDGTFSDEVRHAAGVEPVDHAQLDINDDGLVDLLVVNYGSNDLSLMLGAADGSFTETMRIPVGSGPEAIALADLNGDGRPDVAVTNSQSNDVSVVLSSAAETFVAEQRYLVGAHPNSIAVVDADDDGDLDLAVTHNYSGDLLFLYNRGDGTLEDEDRVYVGRNARRPVSADFNNDGVTDVAVFSRADSGGVEADVVAVSLGDGKAGLGQSTYHAVGTSPQAMEIGDFDGDGNLDLAVIGFDSVSILLGDGSGGFAIRTRYSVETEISPSDLTVTDLNRDGNLDLAIAGNDYHAMLGNGDGTFALPTAVTNEAFYVRDLTASDFDGDGIPELVAIRSNCTEFNCFDGISLLRATDIAGLAYEELFIREAAQVLTVGDLNGDGATDLILGNTGRVAVLLGNGDSTFAKPVSVTIRGNVRQITVRDLNSDGLDDLLVTTEESFTSLFTGTSDAGLQLSQDFNAGRWATELVVGDTNGDGRLDLIGINSDTNSASIASSLGGLFFDFPARITFGDDSPSSVEAADLNRDGMTDLVVGVGHSQIYLFVHGADGEFRRTTVGQHDGARPQVVDYDGDGKLDIVSVNWNSLALYRGDGEGGFPRAAFRALNVGSSDVLFADLNSDGQLDLVRAREDQIYVMLGTGPGEFSASTAYSGGVDASSISTADVNGDGHLDIIITNRNSGDVSVVFGVREGSFVTTTRFPTGINYIMEALVGDFNRDGVPDTVTGSGGTISIAGGRGDGTFVVLSRIFTAFFDTIATGDFNQDGLTDLASLNYEDVRVYPGDGQGDFGEPIVSRRPPTGSAHHALVGDLNADGADDLVVTNMYEGTIELMPGNGDGTFAAVTSTYSVGENPQQSVIVDLNSDGILDIVVASSGLGTYTPSDQVSPGGSYSILLGRGGGEFAPAVVHYFAENDFGGLAVDDLDQDGNLDLVLLNPRGANVLLYEYIPPGDIDKDGRLTAADIDLLFAATRDPEAANLSTFDLNDDAQIDADDVDYWVRELRRTQYGDLDLDGQVGFADFLAMSAHFGSNNASWSNGDADGDTDVDFEDFLRLSEAFGR